MTRENQLSVLARHWARYLYLLWNITKICSGMLKTKRCALAFAGIAAFLCVFFCVFPCDAQVAETADASSHVPTPLSALGHKPGDDFYLANYDESREYFRRLAASSNRIKLINVGKTTRGLDWEVAIISSPENLAALDKYKDIEKKLADGRGLSPDEAHTLAKQGKAIVHIDGGLHSTEVAGA